MSINDQIGAMWAAIHESKGVDTSGRPAWTSGIVEIAVRGDVFTAYPFGRIDHDGEFFARVGSKRTAYALAAR